MAKDAQDTERAQGAERPTDDALDQPPIDSTAADRTTGGTGPGDPDERTSPPSLSVPAEARADGVKTPDQPRDRGPSPLP